MPDVGLFSATDPLPKGAAVIIKYSLEVEGLPVYQESYDVDTLANELEQDPLRACELWIRRLKAPVACRSLHGFSAALTKAIATGQCCHAGMDEHAVSQLDGRGLAGDEISD